MDYGHACYQLCIIIIIIIIIMDDNGHKDDDDTQKNLPWNVLSRNCYKNLKQDQVVSFRAQKVTTLVLF